MLWYVRFGSVRLGYIIFLHLITQKLGFSTLDFILDLGNEILKSYIIEPSWTEPNLT